VIGDSWTVWIQAAAALFSAIAAGAAWAAVVQTRRERKADRFREADRALTELHEAVTDLIGTLYSGGAHLERQQAQLRMRRLVMIQHAYELPKTASLTQLKASEVSQDLASESLSEVETARSRLWREHGKADEIPDRSTDADSTPGVAE
jgi:hypothetical protein